MYGFVKRFFDVVFSSVALILIAPLFLILMLMLRITAEGEVFYFQRRIGLKNKPFYIWKFATMLKDSEKIGTGTITVRNDPRVTTVGKFLRKSKLNELPQLINVFLGSMSFVGPRPLIEKDWLRYPEEYRYKVYNSKPGITGIGSIVFRDEEYLVSSTEMEPHEFYTQFIMPYKGSLEVWYQYSKSFFTDLAILVLTAWVIIFPTSNLYFWVFNNLPKRPNYLKVL